MSNIAIMNTKARVDVTNEETAKNRKTRSASTFSFSVRARNTGTNESRRRKARIEAVQQTRYQQQTAISSEE
jgi:hypothetical protein